MVNYKDIDRAVALRLKNRFPNIDITSKDIEEGISRPSFFIDFRMINAEDFMHESLERSIPITVYFFPREKEKNKIELLEKENDLQILFLEDNILAIDEFTKAEIEAIEFEKVDKVLQCRFDINLFESYEREDTELVMEDLEFNERI